MLTVQLVLPDKSLRSIAFDPKPKLWATFGGLLGVHAYQDGPRVGVRFSNGCTRPDGTGFLGRLYYTSLSILWNGKVIWTTGEARHVFPPRGMLGRRFTIQADGTATRGWKHAGVTPSTSPLFGPALEMLPPVNRAHYAQAFGAMNAQLASALAAGKRLTLYPWGSSGPAPAIDLRTDALGPFMPDGFPDPGAPAGYGIDASVGWEQCDEALDFAALAHECAMDRNPVACFDLNTGEPIACTDWASNHLAHGQLATGEAGVQKNKLELPAFLVGDYSSYRYPNANFGACAYGPALESYQPDNNEHVIRAMRRACALVGWAHDPMALDDLRMLFEHHRTMTFGDRLDDKTHATDGSYVPPSLSALSFYCALNPGRGAQVLRSFGWVMMLGAWAGAPKSWSVRALDCYLAMCDKFGLPQREPHYPYIPTGYKGTQHFHSVLIHRGAWMLARVADWRVADVRATIDRWQQSVLLNRALPLQARPGSTVYGPPKWIYTEGPSGEFPGLSPQLTNEGGFQEHVLALVGGHAQTYLEANDFDGARRELLSCLGVEQPTSTLTAKLTQMRSHTGDQSQYGPYWAMLERIEA